MSKSHVKMSRPWWANNYLISVCILIITTLLTGVEGCTVAILSKSISKQPMTYISCKRKSLYNF